ncbi:hypothetical protein [Rubritalea sp.]|uniref:hypothetical protein n=1 Tax=Rubritalea sp. TaxID=2109375 RepID=UPI003EF36617
MFTPIDSRTPSPKIFEGLNLELLKFIQVSIHEVDYSEALFPDPLGKELWDNPATRDRFEALHSKLHEIFDTTERREFYQMLIESQDLCIYFQNEADSPKKIDARLSETFGNLTVHLYTSSSNLVGVKRHCGETLHEHYEEFMRINGNVCPCCATELLTQFQENTEGDNSWRGPYDHLLPKKDYSQYAVHPHNLLPTCTTCNGKAKKTKDPVIDDEGNPCLCSYPFNQSIHQLVSLKFADGNNFEFVAELTHSDTPAERSWLRLYGMKDRVGGYYRKKTISYITKDCRPTCKDDLKYQVAQKAREQHLLADLEPWDLWHIKLYRWMDQQEDSYFRGLWAAIELRRNLLNDNNNANIQI